MHFNLALACLILSLNVWSSIDQAAQPRDKTTECLSAVDSIGKAPEIANKNQESLQEERKLLLIDKWLRSPVPSLQSADPSNLVWAQSTEAFLLLYRAGTSSIDSAAEISRANQILLAITSDPKYSVAGASDPSTLTAYWALPVLIRTYFHPETAKLLSPQARTGLIRFMADFVKSRSQVADALPQADWNISESENHNVMQRMFYLLAAQALKDVDTKLLGPNWAMSDGNSVQDHYEKWTDYWKRYFSNRAREGMDIEVASPIYEKYTLAGYYNIMDLAEDKPLHAIATNFITLHWADVAQEYILSGPVDEDGNKRVAAVRGGASTRTYKDNYLMSGTSQSSLPLLYAYGWHDFKETASPASLIPLTSSYTPPPIVKAIATNKKNSEEFPESFEYVSRRIGMGQSVDGGYVIQFDPQIQSSGATNGNSNIRRQSYVTPDYILGSMSWSPKANYVSLTNQNRAVGATFASAPDARVMITGIGDAQSPSVMGGRRTGYSEINSVSSGSCMIVARDFKARKNSGTQIFISSAGSLLKNSSISNSQNGDSKKSNWIFSFSKNTHDDRGVAYFAILPLSRYIISTLPGGRGAVLKLIESSAPIIVQMGRKSEYGSFAAFKKAVLARPMNYQNGKLSYTSLQGTPFKYWANSTQRPLVNGKVQALNPDKTYGSPYILGQHGSSEIQLSHPDFPEGLKLEF